jgi:hypothetical protein
MNKEMDFMKIGLYALAGFGAFAVYNKYMGGDKAADVIVVGGGEDATTSFSGTDWQRAGRSRETMWQGSGVYSNASGRTRRASKTARPLFNTWTPGDYRGEVKRTPSGVYSNASGRTRRASKTARPLFNTWTPGDYRGEVKRTSSGVYASANGYSNARGTDWQRSGQALSSGTDWQDVNLNACGGCGA